MACIICGSENNLDTCKVCGFKTNPKKYVFFFFKRQAKKEEYSDEINSVVSFLKWFHELKKINKYISKKDISKYLDKEKENIAFFKKCLKSKNLRDYCFRYHFSHENVELYLKIYERFEDEIKALNEKFISKKLIEEKDYLDHILVKCDKALNLDDDQRIAVLTDEDYCLIIAGAGTGKTTTVAAKVKYLVDKQNINPKDILVISFTNKAVSELKERINEQLNIKCPIATFHSTGRSIILKDTTSSITQIERENFFPINNYLSKLVLEDKDLLRKLVMLFGFYLDIPEELLKINTKEDFFTYKEKTDFATLKSNLNEVTESAINSRSKEKITINNEFLRSIQEVQIANFLYLHNIYYEYEKPYRHRIPDAKKIYTPDFFIKQGNKECYIEHFGITEDYKNNRFSKDEMDTYIRNMKYKINHHIKFGTCLITTFSAYKDGRELIVHLEEELLRNGFKLERKSSEEVYHKILSNDKDKYVSRFSNLASRFIHNFKTKDFSYDDFAVLRTKTNNPRNLLFFDILERVYLYYQGYLKEKNAVDFEDMINDSSKILKNVDGMKDKLNFKYIIVDEYQDISRQRFNLIQQLTKVTEAKFVAVGDDWQSIYAFAGSEIELFTKFKEEVGYAAELHISKTYRNAQELIDIAGEFVLKNPFQKKKRLNSIKHISKPIVIFTYSDDYKKNEKKGIKGVAYERAKVLTEVIGKILKVDTKSNTLLIGRYGFDERHLIETGLFYKDEKDVLKCQNYPQAQLTFLTAHSSKGLTYDNVVIINAQHSIFGFPAQIEDDPVLKFVLYEDKTIEYSEERRLFYVALTRTKNRVFIIAPKLRPSKFVLELLKNYENVICHGDIVKDVDEIKKDRKYCPICGYPLQLRINKAYGQKLYICTNEPEACDFMTNDIRGNGNIHHCDKCDGIMIVKQVIGSNKFFMGCTNYQKNGKGCNNTEDIE